jgi:predicted DCC family thiol-disulfide oxidoreductase YuxK
MAKTAATLIFDGDCGLCTRIVGWLQNQGAADVVAFAPFQSEPAEMAAAGLAVESAARAAYVLEPMAKGWRLHRGAAAVSFMLRALPGPANQLWRVIGRTYFVPGIREVWDLVYLLVSRNRHRFSAWCGLPPRTVS